MADAGQVPEGVRRQNGRARARGREPRQRTQRPTRPFPIKGARARYRRALRAAVRELPPIVRDTIIIEMRRIEQTQDVTGALPVGWIAAVNGAALTAYRRWLGTTGQATNAAAARSFREVNAINMRSVSAQIRSLTGLDVFLPDTGLDDIRQAYLMQNPRLLNVATEEDVIVRVHGAQIVSRGSECDRDLGVGMNHRRDFGAHAVDCQVHQHFA